MKYLKLLVANLFVGLVIAIVLVGFSKADEVDQYEYFDYCMSSKYNNQNRICRQYDFMGPFSWNDEYQENINPNKKQASIPEPGTMMLLWAGALSYGYWRVLK